jgi:hypothetical protein
MANIYTEAKGPKGVKIGESLMAAAASGYTRGLAVTYGADAYHCALALAAAAVGVIGLLEEDVIAAPATGAPGQPSSVIEFGQAVAAIGANVAVGQALTTNAAGQLVPAEPGQPIVAYALEPQIYVSPGSYACVFVVAILGLVVPQGEAVNYIAAAGAIPLVSATYVINGAAALAMTLASPTLAQDGTRIVLVAGTSFAHTVTAAANAIQGNKHIITYAAAYDICILEAVNTKWSVQFIGGPTPAALS